MTPTGSSKSRNEISPESRKASTIDSLITPWTWASVRKTCRYSVDQFHPSSLRLYCAEILFVFCSLCFVECLCLFFLLTRSVGIMLPLLVLTLYVGAIHQRDTTNPHIDLWLWRTNTFIYNITHTPTHPGSEEGGEPTILKWISTSDPATVYRYRLETDIFPLKEVTWSGRVGVTVPRMSFFFSLSLCFSLLPSHLVFSLFSPVHAFTLPFHFLSNVAFGSTFLSPFTVVFHNLTLTEKHDHISEKEYSGYGGSYQQPQVFRGDCFHNLFAGRWAWTLEWGLNNWPAILSDLEIYVNKSALYS